MFRIGSLHPEATNQALRSASILFAAQSQQAAEHRPITQNALTDTQAPSASKEAIVHADLERTGIEEEYCIHWVTHATAAEATVAAGPSR